MGPSFFGYFQFLIERRNVRWPFFTYWLFKVNLSLDVPLLFLKNLIRRMSSNFLRSYLLIYFILFYFILYILQNTIWIQSRSTIPFCFSLFCVLTLAPNSTGCFSSIYIYIYSKRNLQNKIWILFSCGAKLDTFYLWERKMLFVCFLF